MKTYIKKFFDNEILSYLFFGVATTLVSIIVRITIFYFFQQELWATALGNIAGILFAFFTNDKCPACKAPIVGTNPMVFP